MLILDNYISPGFLYSMWNDRLNIKEGCVIRNQLCANHEAQFRYGKRNGDWTKCHPTPGTVVWAKVWLPERNDELARKLLAEYHEACIEDLRKKIASHEEKIKILKDA